MMSQAEGVTRVELDQTGNIVEGRVWTQAYSHLTIGVDDTDSKAGGATFALALALLTRLAAGRVVLPISHHVVMLNETISNKTAGNSASYIEVAVPPNRIDWVVAKSREFVENEALSAEWGLAFRKGLTIPDGLKSTGRQVPGKGGRPFRRRRSRRALWGHPVRGERYYWCTRRRCLGPAPHEIQLDPAGKSHDAALSAVLNRYYLLCDECLCNLREEPGCCLPCTGGYL